MMRLDKFLAHCGYGTRKEVKRIIKNKQVKVNGEIINKDSIKIDENNDEIMVDEFVLNYNKYIYLMVNKPEGYVCANSDNLHPTIFELLVEFDHYDLFTVGRLDIDTTGLLLITNDGTFAHNLMSPKKKVEKLYQVEATGKVTSENIELFENGVIINDDEKCLPAKLEVIEEKTLTTIAQVTISEGKYHQVKKMIQAIGLNIISLTRLKIKDLELDPSLELGEYRFLTDDEVKNLS